MILKEAFRYANFLERLWQNAIMYINEGNVTVKKQEHLRSVANPNAKDETVIIEKDTKFKDYKPIEVVDFMIHILGEKEKLSSAIALAKKSLDIDYDGSISLNKSKQETANTLKRMTNIQSSEYKSTGMDYTFNAEGNQVPYKYTIKEVVTIDFDRNKIKGLYKKLLAECDKISAEIDKFDVMTEVNYIPIYDINESIEDCLEVFIDKK